MYAFLPRILPDRLRPLRELALDLRWTWSHAVDALWSRIDPELWERTHNPWVVLQNASQARLDELARDAAFLQELEVAAADCQRYRSGPGFCATPVMAEPLPTVAYFSMEFGLSEAFPLYAGGLGILAGDYLKTASDLGVPSVGVSLLYQEGYFRQVIDSGGRQHAAYPYNDPTSLPIQPAIGDDGGWLEIELELPGRILYLRVWQARVGRTQLYLLDSNDVRNGAVDRGITAKLYGGGSEMRLLQEVVLGIGGWMMLDALGIKPDICHLNEGHAALAVLERARRFMRDHGTGFRDAWWATRAGNVFTTHTPVAAAFDTFPPSLVFKYSRDYLADFDMPLRDLLALGRRDPDDNNEPFNLTYLALRGCAQANAVSRLHGEVSRALFEGLYPRWPRGDVPLRHVTNGVHVPSWDSQWSDGLWTRACGKERWLGDVQSLTDAIAAIDDEALWALATSERRDLVRYARERMAWQLGQRGESPARVAEAAQVLDPNALTLGLARRFTAYKRPNLLLHDPERLARLLGDMRRPVQLIVAGKAHTDDEEGKRLIQAWMEFMRRQDVRHRAVFLEDYDMALAQQMVQGVDVWINTPRRPWEACGTSGMKTLVNGGLNLSELDGWWAEAYRPEYGWAIDGCGDDVEDAATLYRILEQDVVPTFHTRDAKGVPRAWVQRMRASMSELAPRFSSNRMLLEYLHDFYVPAAGAYRRRCADDGRLARTLKAWEQALADHWHEVHFGALELHHEGGDLRLDVPVYLGGIAPDSVRVELYADADGEQPAECLPMRIAGELPGAVHGHVYSVDLPASRQPGRYTPRVRAWHAEAFLPAESGLIAWQR